MVVVTVFEPNGNSIWFKSCHHDHIPFNVKGNGNIVFSVYHFHNGQEYNCSREAIASRHDWGPIKSPQYRTDKYKGGGVLNCSLITPKNMVTLELPLNFV